MDFRLRLEGLEFDGGAGSPRYTVAAISGLESVGIRRENTERPNAHGSFAAPGFFEARRISWSGLVLTDSEPEQDHAVRSLAGLLGGGTGRLIAQGASTVWSDVQRVSVESQVVTPGMVASYSVSVEAPDPFLYGEVATFGPDVSLSVYHYGNTGAAPDVTVTGSMPSGYQVNGPGGAQYIVSQALTSGVTHRIDFNTGWLYRNGVMQQGAVSRAETFVIPSGTPSTMSLAPVSGSGLMTVKLTDTFS